MQDENSKKDELKEKAKKELKSFKLSNKIFVLIFLLSPLIFGLLFFCVPFATLAYIFYATFEFKKDYRRMKQRHLRATNNLIQI